MMAVENDAVIMTMMTSMTTTTIDADFRLTTQQGLQMKANDACINTTSYKRRSDPDPILGHFMFEKLRRFLEKKQDFSCCLRPDSASFVIWLL